MSERKLAEETDDKVKRYRKNYRICYLNKDICHAGGKLSHRLQQHRKSKHEQHHYIADVIFGFIFVQ